MEERASGIILRTRPLTETSLIVHLLTRELGRIALVAKGARRPKSSFSGKLDLFYEVEISFSRSRKSELHNLREVSLRETHSAVRQDLARLNVACYAAVLIELGTETETPVPEFHELMQHTLQTLDRVSPAPTFTLGFETKFLRLLGSMPDSAVARPETQRVLSMYSESSLEAANELRLPSEIFIELEHILRRAIGMALERIPPLRERALQAGRASTLPAR